MRFRATGAALLIACTSSVPAPEPIPTFPVSAPTRRTGTPAGKPAAATTPPSVENRGSEPPVRDVGDTTIRVLLTSDTPTAHVSSSDGLTFTTRDGRLVARTARGESWLVERDGRRVRAVRPDGIGTVWSDNGIVARTIGSALLSLGGKPYRGDIAFSGGDSGVMVVNILKIDDYVRGVVPLEIGTRAEADSAAVQAQAVTARSYAYTRLNGDPNRLYDLTGGVLDQVYGGVAVETAVASEAVETTRTLVLKYNGRIVNAPYHSTCGGSTASASEVWRSGDEPYLQSVSDRIPGTDRYYCDQAPRFRWTRVLDAPTLNAALARYLATYASVPGRKPGIANGVAVAGHTPSGRNSAVTITTDRGVFAVRGNDMRYVLRAPGGEILNSTSFTVETKRAADGSLGTLTIRGNGNGHGVGMCQAGAIGRARAGQDFRTILHAYYQGTTVGPP